MALFYVAVGFFLGGVSALVVMAMFFVAKRAGDNAEEMCSDLTSAVSQQKIT